MYVCMYACFGHFTIKLCKFANFKILFPAVSMDILLLVFLVSLLLKNIMGEGRGHLFKGGGV